MIRDWWDSLSFGQQCVAALWLGALAACLLCGGLPFAYALADAVAVWLS